MLVNPLIYVTEGFRAALTTSNHMPLYVIYPVLVGALRALSLAGHPGLPQRVLA